MWRGTSTTLRPPANERHHSYGAARGCRRPASEPTVLTAELTASARVSRPQLSTSAYLESISRWVIRTNVARGQSKVALSTLQPVINTGTLAGGAARVSGVRLRS